VLAAAVGLVSARLPIKIVFGLIGAAALFALVYKNIQAGLILFLIFNATLPSAGPTLGLGLQIAVVGEARGLHFNIHEIIMAFVLVAWLVKVFFKKASWRESSPLMIPVLVFILAAIFECFVGLLNGAHGLLVVFRFVRTTFFAYIFFVIINNVKTKKQIQQLVVIFLLCVTLVAGFGLVQKVLGQGWTERFAKGPLAKLGYPAVINYVAGASDTNQYRVNSTFAHPNVLGAYLALALPFFVSLLWLYRKRWQSALLIVGLAIVLLCLFFTGSRAAWMALGVIAILYGVLGFLDKRMILTVVTVLAVIMIAFVILAPPTFIKQRFVSPSATEAANARLYQYTLAADVFMEHPLFGVGMGMEGQMLTVNNMQQMWAAVENVYLTYLVSNGLLGLMTLLLLFVVFWVLLLFARSNSTNPLIKYYSEACILGIVGIAVASLLGAWLLFAIPMLTLFWTFIGLGASLFNIYQREEKAALESDLARARAGFMPRLESG
jgi:putative inorganic carbon (HCO3(-)) transporter